MFLPTDWMQLNVVEIEHAGILLLLAACKEDSENRFNVQSVEYQPKRDRKERIPVDGRARNVVNVTSKRKCSNENVNMPLNLSVKLKF